MFKSNERKIIDKKNSFDSSQFYTRNQISANYARTKMNNNKKRLENKIINICSTKSCEYFFIYLFFSIE